MSLQIFSDNFRFGQPHRELRGRTTLFTEAVTGKQFRRAIHDYSRLVIETTTLQFPNCAGGSYVDLIEFWDAVGGPVGEFLVKFAMPEHYQVADESAGTSTGVADEQFAIAKRYVDASKLVVKVGGVTQTLTTDYTLEGNTLEGGAEPYVKTTASFDAGAVTFDYEFYIRCRFDVEDLSAQLQVHSNSLANPGSKQVILALSEVIPGDHLVS